MTRGPNQMMPQRCPPSGVGLESLLNPTSLRFHQVAKQPKYNGNPRCWPQFQREFKLWVKTQKLHEDQLLTALLDCLEGPPANTWLRTWSACEGTTLRTGIRTPHLVEPYSTPSSSGSTTLPPYSNHMVHFRFCRVLNREPPMRCAPMICFYPGNPWDPEYCATCMGFSTP